MELYKIRSRISMGESLYDLPLKVTFYARVSTDKDVQLKKFCFVAIFRKETLWKK